MFKFNYIQFLILVMIFSLNAFAVSDPGACHVTVSSTEHEFMGVLQEDCEDNLTSHVSYDGTTCTVVFGDDSWSLETTQEDCLGATSTWEAPYFDYVLCAPAAPDSNGPLRIISTGFYKGGNNQCYITALLNMNINKDASLNKRKLLREMLRCLVKHGKGWLIHRPPTCDADFDLIKQCKEEAIAKLKGKVVTWQRIHSVLGRVNNILYEIGWINGGFTAGGANSPCNQVRTANSNPNKSVGVTFGHWTSPGKVLGHIMALRSIKCDPPDGENSMQAVNSNGSIINLTFDSDGMILSPPSYQYKVITGFRIETLQ